MVTLLFMAAQTETLLITWNMHRTKINLMISYFARKDKVILHKNQLLRERKLYSRKKCTVSHLVELNSGGQNLGLITLMKILPL